MTRFVARALWLCIAALPLVACGESSGEVEADCTLTLSYEELSYTEIGFMRGSLTKVGTGSRPPCNDDGGTSTVGKSAQVNVFEIPSYQSGEVVAAMKVDGQYRVFAADDQSAKQIAQLRGEFAVEQSIVGQGDACTDLFFRYAESYVGHTEDPKPSFDTQCKAPDATTDFGTYMACAEQEARLGSVVAPWGRPGPEDCAELIGRDVPKLNRIARNYDE